MLQILSGGGVICAPAFDAVAFWNCMEEQKVTWYYAGGTCTTFTVKDCKMLKDVQLTLIPVM